MSIDPRKASERQSRIRATKAPPVQQPVPRGQPGSKGGGGMKLVVVAALGLAPADYLLQVRTVKRNASDPWNGGYVLSATTEEMNVWPGLVSEDYNPFLWAASPTWSVEAHVLAALQDVLDGRWYVAQTMRFSFLDPAPNVAISDCSWF
ncbi:MAG: hypothetical protein AABZ47_10135 [Planctomycetota bacterium]